MKNFVKLIEQVHNQRFSTVIERIVLKKIPVAFLSISPVNESVEIVKKLRSQGLNITNLITFNATPPPTQSGFDVVHVSNAVKNQIQPEYIFALTDFEVAAALKYFPNAKSIIFDGNNKENMYKTFMAHLSDLREVYESLIDEESKKTFRGYWLGNISNQLGEIVHANTPHYICAGFIPERGAIVIDGGTFDGGSAKIFTEMGYKVYGFEMDKANYAIARKVAEENNFVVENMGLGFCKQEGHYNSSGSSANKLNPYGSDTVQITSIDSYVRENDIPRIDFIKLDVEGAELDTLKGATYTIARFKPILALSAYHKWDDFWTLMNFVKSIRPDYEFAMRQFFISRDDEPAMYERYVESTLLALGLELKWKRLNECVLFAK